MYCIQLVKATEISGVLEYFVICDLSFLFHSLCSSYCVFSLKCNELSFVIKLGGWLIKMLRRSNLRSVL